jgi:hypothetical protein
MDTGSRPMNRAVGEFIKLHRSLLIRFVTLDVLLGVSSALFLSVTLTVSALSLTNLTLLVVAVSFAVFYQMHWYRTYCGNVAFYLMLPIERTKLLPILAINSIAPVIVALVMYGCIWIAFKPTYQPGVNCIGFTDRVVYILVVLVISKVLPLPIAILFKKHVMLVPFFLGILSLVYFFLSFIAEMLSGLVAIDGPAMALLFMGCVVLIAAKILARATIE